MPASNFTHYADAYYDYTYYDYTYYCDYTYYYDYTYYDYTYSTMTTRPAWSGLSSPRRSSTAPC